LTVDPNSEKLFATGSHDKTIKLWDATKPQKALNVLTGNKQGVWCLNYSHDSKKLLSASSDGLCKIWDAKSGKMAAELTAHQGAKAYFAQWNNDSTFVATCGSDKLICLYDVRNTKAPVFKNAESESVVISCDFTNDQKHIISTTYDGVLNITSIATQKVLLSYKNFGTPKTDESNALHCCRSVKGHPDGNFFLVGGENTKTVGIHFDPTAKFESQFLESRGVYTGHSDALRHITHNKQGDLMLSSCADHSLRIWDMNTTRCMALFSGHTGLVSVGKFLNAKTNVSASWDQTICFWDYTEALKQDRSAPFVSTREQYM